MIAKSQEDIEQLQGKLVSKLYLMQDFFEK
jgi:hypothetical protein